MAEVGEGGKIAHRMADAALERRGNAAMRGDLEDAHRLFDPVLERKWEQKYKFHSARHMKGNFRTFARARHDPFNKDPAWGKAVLGEISSAVSRKGKTPDDLFKGVDLGGDGTLNRPEMKKVICGVFPTLSDAELTAVFDSIDQDRSGEVNVNEFLQALKTGMSPKSAKEISDRWRNPIHRARRFPPAPIEGWSHLDNTEPAEHLHKVVDRRQHEIMSRLGSSLVETPRTQKPSDGVAAKYSNFAGGGASERFHRQNWHRDRGVSLDARLAALATTQPSRLADPGLDMRPGFMCDPEGRNTLLANGWRVATPRGPP